MTEITRPERPDWKKYIFQCDTDDHHFLLFEWWLDSQDEWPGVLSVIPCVWVPNLRQRIVTAVKVLFGRRHWTSDCVLLNEAEARRLRSTLDLFIASEERKRG